MLYGQRQIIVVLGRYYCKLEVVQSPTLARPAAPLAACFQRINSLALLLLAVAVDLVPPTTEFHRNLDKSNKNWLPR